MIIYDGNTTPNVAIREPGSLNSYPTHVAAFIAIGPGVLSAIPIILRNSSSLIHFSLQLEFYSIYQYSITPPNIIKPIFKNTRNNSR